MKGELKKASSEARSTFRPPPIVFDGAIVRSIAGEFSEEFLLRTTRKAGVDVSRRMASLMSKHLHVKTYELGALGETQRRRMANDIVSAELEERHTMPGRLTPLRTFDRE